MTGHSAAGEASALAGVVVIDLADELAAYASRLLADLGADVTRVERPDGARLAGRPPLITGSRGGEFSVFERFVNAGKRSVALDLDDEAGRRGLEELLCSADIVIESSAPILDRHWSAEQLADLKPDLIRVVVTPFGLDQSRSWSGTDDLIVMAEGGLLHLGGYADLGPVVAHGGQSEFAASIFAAVAAISGMLVRDATAEGGTYDVSAQECIAQALEDSAATYSLTGHVRERLGDRPREAGTGVYRCRDGYVSMVAGRLGTAKAWTALVAWLNEEQAEGAALLQGDDWQRFEFRQSERAITAFARIFEAFALQRDKAELYREAQRRMIALSPVSTVADLLANEQLRDRDFFVTVADEAVGRELVYPRAPYSMSLTPPLVPRSAPAPVSAVARTEYEDVAGGGAR